MDSSETRLSQDAVGNDSELADAVRDLASQVGSLRTDVQALRGETQALPAGSEIDRHGWDESAAPVTREGPAWVRSVDSPRPRGIAVPWLVVEILFLVAVAVLCAVAGLDAPVIAGVMLAAWILVALGEWLVARAERDRFAVVYRAGTPPVVGAPEDRSWFDSNRDDTLLDAPSAERPPARLPPPE